MATNIDQGLTVDGVPVGGAGGFPFDAPGSHFFADSVSGNDDNPGTSWTLAKKTIKAGYALCTTNKNDVLHLIGRATEYAQAAVLTFDKDYTHIVGHTSPIPNGGRVRLTNTVTTATAGEYVISGTGCTFVNIHFQYGDSATVTSLVGVALSGSGRNAFINCEFEGPFYDVNANQRMLTITSSQDNYFRGCSFGQRTILNTQATAAVVSFNGANNTGNTFEDCTFHLYNSSTASGIINYISGAMPTSGYTKFKRSTFLNHTSVAVADIIRNTSAADGMVILDNCSIIGLGTTVWATNLKTNIFVTVAVGAATGGKGVNP